MGHLTFPLLVTLIAVALAFDFLNGLHDAANSIATVVSTRVLRPHHAVAWAAFFNFIAFLFFGLHVAQTLGKGIVEASIIDPHKRTITYANAGHNFPYLFRKGEDGKGEFGSLMIRGNRLGDVRESKYEIKTQELLAGDVLVWYTDGIVECESSTGEEYGEKRFRASVRRAAALDAAEMRDAIVADANEFFGDVARKDDITMIVGRIQ